MCIDHVFFQLITRSFHKFTNFTFCRIFTQNRFQGDVRQTSGRFVKIGKLFRITEFLQVSVPNLEDYLTGECFEKDVEWQEYVDFQFLTGSVF